MSPKTTKTTFLLLTAALPVSAVLLHLAQTHHTGMVLYFYLHGKATNCTLWESFEASELSRLHSENVNELHASSNVIRADGDYSLWSTALGEFWVPTSSGHAILYDLAEQQRNIYGTRIRAGDIVLDAGANVGVFTRKALWAGASKVIAIEPGPENLECLRRTFASEIRDGRVVLFPKGVWDKDDVLKFAVNPSNSAMDSFVRPIENANYISVPVTTIDRLVMELKLPRVDFIKMDIEGAEQKAVVGARSTITTFRPRMALCVYHLKEDALMVPKLIAAAYPGYQVSRTCLCTDTGILPEVAFFY